MSKLAINGGSPVREKPFSQWPIYDDNENQYLQKALESRLWCKTAGKFNDEFEEKFARFQEVKHALTVCNGTIALRIALFAAGVSEGDEVIVPSYTFIATATSVIEANAVPVFADVEPDSFNISPESIEKLITPRTKAIIPVHFGGAPANMEKIMQIAKRHNLKVIEDAAQAQGAAYNGKTAGAWGDAGTFSFQLSKNMTSGEGGAIVTNDDEIAERCWSYHNCGRKPESQWYYHYNMGGNFRLSEFQAAVLLAQLQREKDSIALRTKNAKYLDKLLTNTEGVTPILYPDNVKSSYYLYILKYNSSVFNNLPKMKFVKAMNAEGIPMLEGYPYPLYKQPVFKNKNFWAAKPPVNSLLASSAIDYNKCYDPESEKACECGLWFPNYLLHGTEKDLEDIVKAIDKIRENISELSGDLK